MVPPQKSYIAKFWGKHNRSKGKVLLYLAVCSQNGDKRRYTAAELHHLTGVPLSTLYHRLPKWAKWGYVLVKKEPVLEKWWLKSRAVYKISAKGMRYCTDTIPEHKRQQYWQEMVEHQENKRL
jgi:hypothetical protein